MRRREFAFLFGGATVAWPLLARAQQKTVPIIGFLIGRSQEGSAHLIAGFRQGLAETGFVEGPSLAIDYRWAEGRYDRLAAFAADLVGRKVDAIVTVNTDAARAAIAATGTTPIVFINGSDPVSDHLVTNLARPSGNVTGVTFLAQELNRKLFEVLRELVPQARAIAVLLNQKNSTSERQLRDFQEVARGSGVELNTLEASTKTS